MLWFTKNILSLKKEISVTIISFGNFTQVSNYEKKKKRNLSQNDSSIYPRRNDDKYKKGIIMMTSTAL